MLTCCPIPFPGSTHGQTLDTAVTHSIAVVAAFMAAQDDESQDGAAGDRLPGGCDRIRT